MDYIFQLSSQRTIAEANYNTLVTPILHPDRIMQQHDFLYILDGTWEILLENAEGCEVLQAEKDTLLLLPAKIHHYGVKPCSPNCRNMYIHVSAITGDHAAATSNGDNNRNEEDCICLSSVIHCGSSAKIAGLFTEIIAVYWGNSDYKQRKLNCLFELLLYEIREQQQNSLSSSQDCIFVDKVTKHLQANPQFFFSVPEIAAKYDVSVRTLNNRFKKVHGKTFYTWQMEQKLEMAYQFLRSNPDTTLRESALNFGFYDEFHFSRMFKKHFGMAPKYMRQPFQSKDSSSL